MKVFKENEMAFLNFITQISIYCFSISNKKDLRFNKQLFIKF